MRGFYFAGTLRPPVGLCLVIVALLPQVGTAAVMHVDQARLGEGNGDGASWASAFRTVNEALAVANAGDEIWVARGTYPERIMLPAGVKFYGGFNATETLLSARDWKLNRSILDGEAGGTVVVVELGAGADTRIDGLVIRNGYGGPGGGVQAIGASPVIANNWVHKNAATVAGGGIYLANSGALVISNRIEGNYITNYQEQIMAGGGGIVSSNGAPIILGNQIVRNSAVYGGGIRCWEGSAQIAGNAVVGNQSLFLGGGIEIAFASTVVEGNRIVGNVVTQGPSGGISVVGPGSTTLRNNLIMANQVSNGAGGIYAETGSHLLLAGNTLLGNRGYSFGRAVQIEGANFDAVNNLVAFGGSVFLSTTTGWRHNCVFGNEYSNYESGMTDPTGTDGNISVDPMLGWSRERAEFHLQPGSPCIGAGTMSGLSLGDFDIDGEVRVFGSMVDIGADELGNQPQTFVPRILRVAVSGNDANDGSTWPAAKRTIQAALDDALRDAGEVWVAEGLYEESIDLRPLVKMFGGFAGDETLRAERGAGLNLTVIDAGGVTNVVRGEYLDQVAELNGFTIRSGRAPRGGGVKLRYAPVNIVGNRLLGNGAYPVQSGISEGPADAGGGIFTDASDAFIMDNTIQQNFVMRGGAIFVRAGRPRIERNLIINNVATNSGNFTDTSAGIVLASGDVVVANNMFLANLAVVGNISVNAATAIWAGMPAWIVNNTFLGNTSELDSSITSPGSSVNQAAVFVNANGSLVANNIFHSNVQGIRTSSHPSQTIVNNCFFRQLGTNFAGMPAPDEGAGNLFVDPQLVGPYALLHLAADSPCRNAGNDAHVGANWKDADGDDRILEGMVDIGADEFTGTVTTVPRRMVFVREDGNDLADGRAWTAAKRTVQAAIDTAFALGGAEVWVARGRYPELIQVKPFTYLHGGFVGDETSTTGRDLLANQTVIDAHQSGTAVTIESPGAFSALTGFTIINGRGFFGGGVYCRPLSAPLIAHNRIFNCSSVVTADHIALRLIERYFGGGGIRGEMASPVIANNLIVSNTAGSITVFGRVHAGAGGISLSGGSNSVVAHNTLVRNVTYQDIGSISVTADRVEIKNNIIAFNTGGISASTGTNPLIETNLFFGNDLNGLTGASPILADPRFIDDQATFFLADDSPCLDTGLSLAGQTGWTDVYGRLRLAGLASDIGAVEMQPNDTVLPVTQMPTFTVEVVGGIAYLKYERTKNGDESGELLPEPYWIGTNLFWSFAVSRDLAGSASPESFTGAIPLGALYPGRYRVNPVSWGVPLAITEFLVPTDSNGTIANPVLSEAGFEFALNGVEYVRHITEHSVNWGPWAAVATNDTATGSVLIPADRLTGRDYFRVRLEPREVSTP